MGYKDLKKDKAYRRKYYQDHKEKIDTYNKKYRQNHKDSFTHYNKKSRKIHREKRVQYSKKWNKEHKEYHKKWTNEHRKDRRKSGKKWYDAHKECKKKYRETHRKQFSHYSSHRQALNKNADGSHTFGEWQTLKVQYNWTCPACRKKEPFIKLTRDHIIPLSKGGSDNIENIQPLCGSCNSKKYTREEKYEYKK